MKRALVSVSDKSGLVEFVSGLVENGYEIISTGGTKKALEQAGLKPIGISEVTGFPEILDGRVKTLHPKVHGGLLSVRSNPDHMRQIKELGIECIDMVVVNLYPFKETVQKDGVSHEEIIENIDIGGPCMVRASAKNNKYVAIVTNPAKYGEIIDILKKDGQFTDAYRLELAREAFQHTAQYDTAIAAYLSEQVEKGAAD